MTFFTRGATLLPNMCPPWKWLGKDDRPRRLASVCCQRARTRIQVVNCKKCTSASYDTGSAPLTGRPLSFPLRSSHTSPKRQGHTSRGTPYESIQPPVQPHPPPLTRAKGPPYAAAKPLRRDRHTASATPRYSTPISTTAAESPAVAEPDPDSTTRQWSSPLSPWVGCSVPFPGTTGNLRQAERTLHLHYRFGSVHLTHFVQLSFRWRAGDAERRPIRRPRHPLDPPSSAQSAESSASILACNSAKRASCISLEKPPSRSRSSMAASYMKPTSWGMMYLPTA